MPPNVKHLIIGTVSLWTRPPAVHPCTGGPKKIPTHRVRALQPRNRRSYLHSEPPGIFRCTQRACNNIVQARIRRAATVGSRLSPHRLHLRNLLDLHTRTSIILSKRGISMVRRTVWTTGIGNCTTTKTTQQFSQRAATVEAQSLLHSGT